MDNRLIYNLIEPRVFVGDCPRGAADIERLSQQLSVTAVLTLQTEEDRRLYQLDWPVLLRAYERERIQVFELPVQDQSESALEERLFDAVNLLNGLVRAGHCVLLHCNAGNGRSPTVAAAWLHWRRGWDLDRAVSHLRGCRRCEPNPEVIQRASQKLHGPAIR